MTKILIIGSYGWRNIGEEAVLMAILNRIGRENQITVTSGNPIETKLIHGIDTINGKIPYSDFDKIIVGGCGIFYEGSALSYSRHIIEAKKYDIPVEILSVGVGPLWKKDTFEATKEAFEIADKINVRTNFAKIILKEGMKIRRNDVQVERDISCQLPKVDCSKVVKDIYGDGPYLGVSIKNTPWIYWNNLFDMIQSYLDDGYTVVPIFNCWHFSFGDRSDAVGFNFIEKHFQKHLNKWGAILLSPLIMKGVIGVMNHVISQTVHTNLWSDAEGVPSTALVPKNNFHPMAFKQLGAKEILYSTSPDYIEKNRAFMKWRGIEWDKI